MIVGFLKRSLAICSNLKRTHKCKCLSSLSTRKGTFTGISQGGNLVFDVRELLSPVIVIESKWQDHVDVEYNAENMADINFNEQVKTTTLEIIGKGRKEDIVKRKDDQIYLLVTVPELINISLVGNNVDLTLKNKIHGNVNIKASSGNIIINKLRGSNIEIIMAKGNVSVMKLMEGNVVIESQKLKAKMLNGDKVELKCTECIHVEAMYAKRSFLRADHDVNIGLVSGETNIYSKYGDINIGGVDGTFNVIADEGHINMQINKSICEVNSRAYSKKKSITVYADPKVKANVYFEVLSQSRAKVTVVSEGFKPIKDISVCNNIIIGSINKSEHFFQRAQMAYPYLTSGKINTKGSEDQSLHTILPLNDDITTLGTSNECQSITEENATFAFVAYGNIFFESLSWIEAIRRRHGFNKPDEGTLSNGIGRTASSKRRAQEIVEKSIE